MKNVDFGKMKAEGKRKKAKKGVKRKKSFQIDSGEKAEWNTFKKVFISHPFLPISFSLKPDEGFKANSRALRFTESHMQYG
jgi:hypothetical protein